MRSHYTPIYYRKSPVPSRELYTKRLPRYPHGNSCPCNFTCPLRHITTSGYSFSHPTNRCSFKPTCILSATLSYCRTTIGVLPLVSCRLPDAMGGVISRTGLSPLPDLFPVLPTPYAALYGDNRHDRLPKLTNYTLQNIPIPIPHRTSRSQSRHSDPETRKTPLSTFLTKP